MNPEVHYQIAKDRTADLVRQSPRARTADLLEQSQRRDWVTGTLPLLLIRRARRRLPTRLRRSPSSTA
jgi:hypothetical protein